MVLRKSDSSKRTQTDNAEKCCTAKPLNKHAYGAWCAYLCPYFVSFLDYGLNLLQDINIIWKYFES